MPQTPPIMSLHLRYRLWIAEMNSDIDVIRIFGDYLKELDSRRAEIEVKSKIDYFQQQFVNLRKQIDELRDQMHIIKMKLAAYSRATKDINYTTYQKDKHTSLKKSYLALKKKFSNIKEEFVQFEAEWL